ncbi:Nramp family divalent metal transporter [Methylobacterium nodulans]|uniref:Natural resistance-associated macrophage protein n=1 Tax=Methylobacterium nodulans (strain LMG 21967 / CNCM I-2342 / ORS 2060) TaxID=460265 RepID=B8IRT7_METNO|nr:Nramp family divalent metal transporter [Methylobacterium nodulans]ACL60637.1 natural resistance-associated macrophage protein [Methylobacterium nodulans ORS 2060]
MVAPSERVVSTDDGVRSPAVGPTKPRLLMILGPGLITGASDDDPSGIATYSQAGAQFGYTVLWTMLFSYPLMAAVQEISARLGRTTGRGIAGNLRKHYSSGVALAILPLLLFANIVNLGADLGAMAEALSLLSGGPRLAFVVLLGGGTIAMQMLLKHTRYVSVLKWLSLSLLSYFGTALMVNVPWGEALHGLLVPSFHAGKAFWLMVVAVLGTTISPYLFFWQAAQEVEDTRAKPARDPLKHAPEQAPAALARIRLDTLIGMGFSNLVALAIMVTTAATLHANGASDIQTSTDAAKALEPIVGRFAFAVFTLGIVGTGFLALPVLGGSAAYALGEFRRWPVGLERKPVEAKAFYAALAAATVLGAAVTLSPISPINALFWSAVVNGVLAAPVMALLMLMVANPKIMGGFVITGPLRVMGWIATGAMLLAALTLGVTSIL